MDEPIAVHGILEKDEEFLYRVSAGESVSGIALRELGSTGFVKEVIWANQLNLPGLTEGCEAGETQYKIGSVLWRPIVPVVNELDEQEIDFRKLRMWHWLEARRRKKFVNEKSEHCQARDMYDWHTAQVKLLDKVCPSDATAENDWNNGIA